MSATQQMGVFQQPAVMKRALSSHKLITQFFKPKQIGQRVASTMNQTVIRGLGTNSIQ